MYNGNILTDEDFDMAYVSQERKAELAPQIKAVLKKYGIKGSISVGHGSTLRLKITSGKIDFINNCNRVCGNDHYQVSRGFRPITNGWCEVNQYWYHEHFDGEALSFLTEVLEAMNVGNHDRSDIMTDYFDVGWYVNIRIGNWDKPYTIVN